MRKYVSWIVGAVLVGAALLAPNGGTASIAGTGTGESAKITQVKQVGELLACLSEKTGEEPMVYTAPTSIKNMAAKSQQEEYESVTLSIESSANIITKWGENTYSQSSSTTKMTRSLQCYFTKDEAFYVADATIITSSSSSSRNKSNKALSVAFELYIGEEVQCVKITRWGAKYNYTIDGEKMDGENDDDAILSEIINRWVDAEELGETLISINALNYEILSIFGEYILEVDSNKFVKSGNTYSLKSGSAKELCSEICGLTDGFDEASFSVDLSNATSPCINFLYTADYSHKDSNYSVSYKGGEMSTIVLSNINNTVINFPEDITVYSLEDFE